MPTTREGESIWNEFLKTATPQQRKQALQLDLDMAKKKKKYQFNLASPPKSNASQLGVNTAKHLNKIFQSVLGPR